MARRLHDHWLIGLSTSVLTHEFVTSYQHGDDVKDLAPFSGRLMLPTKLQVLKLHLFFRDEAGKKNQNVSKGEITAKVVKVLKYYWNIAGFETVAYPPHKVAKLVEAYQDQLKKRNMSNKKTIEDRKKFEEDLNKLLDIAHPDLEKKLTQDRIRLTRSWRMKLSPLSPATSGSWLLPLSCSPSQVRSWRRMTSPG